jgi:hypothetical protein
VWRSATRARSELCSKKSGSATVPATKGSCEIQRDGVVLQSGSLNAVYGPLQVDITS